MSFVFSPKWGWALAEINGLDPKPATHNEQKESTQKTQYKTVLRNNAFNKYRKGTDQ
jgi:hypothetical protein